MMFSRPERLALKPTPRESSGLIRPLTSMRPSVGGRMPGQRAHQRGLAGAVGADDAERRAVRDVEGDVLERLDLADRALAATEAG